MRSLEREEALEEDDGCKGQSWRSLGRMAVEFKYWSGMILRKRKHEVFEEMEGLNVVLALEDFKDFEETSTLNVDEAFSSLIQIFKFVSSIIGLESSGVQVESGAVGLVTLIGLAGVGGDESCLGGLATLIRLCTLIRLARVNRDESYPVGLGTLIGHSTRIGLAGIGGDRLGNLDKIFEGL
ncbi:hypothetical protein MA16_Dca000288 [Dendrobium catenatum]|uniref:Uncharacterized protein n=1 Tax=Dendrobium catenatum TaxID=906689 RepID=A0A2I0WTF8_9ASPA|nr:hypothetical protein MA16_Dca000288 [Dendrobium catenatum]